MIYALWIVIALLALENMKIRREFKKFRKKSHKAIHTLAKMLISNKALDEDDWKSRERIGTFQLEDFHDR